MNINQTIVLIIVLVIGYSTVVIIAINHFEKDLEDIRKNKYES